MLSGLRVMVVSHEASRTGATAVAVDLLRALKAAGAEVVLVHRWGGPRRAEMDAMVDRSLVEPMSRVRVLLRRSPRTDGVATRIERWAVRRTVRRCRPDLVWCNTLLSAPYAPAAQSEGIPAVLHSHESSKMARRWLGRAWPSIGDVSLERLTLLACAPDVAGRLAESLEVEPSGIRVVTSAVDVAALSASSFSDPSGGVGERVVACGLGNPSKGVDVFAAAARLDVAQGRSRRWIWVGTDDWGERPPEVEWVGAQPEGAAWLAHADVVVVPSRTDSFPLVVLEAMALGRAIVASDIPGTRLQLADTGWLVEPSDPSALLAAVDSVLADPSGASRRGESARSRCLELWDRPAFDRAVVATAAAAVGRSVG